MTKPTSVSVMVIVALFFVPFFLFVTVKAATVQENLNGTTAVPNHNVGNDMDSLRLEQVLLRDMILPHAGVKCKRNSQTSTKSRVISFNYTYSSSNDRSDWGDSATDHEQDVFLVQMTVERSNDRNRSYTARFGVGGQLYSLYNDGFGEAIAPQLTNDSLWMDEVWTNVGIPQQNHQKEAVSGGVHGSGTYLRDPTLGNKTFYAPTLAHECFEDACLFAVWAQQAHVPTTFQSSLMGYWMFRDCGNGVVEHTNLMHVFDGPSKLTEMKHVNSPWVGLRLTSFKDVLPSFRNTSSLQDYHKAPFPNTMFQYGMIQQHKTDGYITYAQDLPLPDGAEHALDMPCYRWKRDCTTVCYCECNTDRLDGDNGNDDDGDDDDDMGEFGFSDLDMNNENDPMNGSDNDDDNSSSSSKVADDNPMASLSIQEPICNETCSTGKDQECVSELCTAMDGAHVCGPQVVGNSDDGVNTASLLGPQNNHSCSVRCTTTCSNNTFQFVTPTCGPDQYETADPSFQSFRFVVPRNDGVYLKDDWASLPTHDPTDFPTDEEYPKFQINGQNVPCPYPTGVNRCRYLCGFLFTNTRTDRYIVVREVRVWAFRNSGRTLVFLNGTEYKTDDLNNNVFVEGDEIRVTIRDCGKAPEDNLSISFVHGRWNDTSVIRYGVANQNVMVYVSKSL